MNGARARAKVAVWFVLAGVVTMTLDAPSVRAQSLRPPEVGDRIRIASPQASGVFLVTGLRPDSLVLRTGASEAFPISIGSIYRLQIQEGTHSRRLGALGGGVVGALAGGLVALPCWFAFHLRCDTVSPAQRVEIGAGVGVLLGAFAWGGRPRWGPAALVEQPAVRTPRR
jgi:hypothetical protein